MIRLFVLMAICISLTACGDTSNNKRLEIPAPKALSYDEWEAAIKSTYTSSHEEMGDDGKLQFLACLENLNNNKCGNGITGIKDEFEKKYSFLSLLLQYITSTPELKTHIDLLMSVDPSQRPYFTLSSVYVGKRKIGLNSISIMADGNVIFEKKLENVSIKETEYKVFEYSATTLNNLDVIDLRKIKQSKKVIIRLNGDIDTAGVPKETVQSIVNEFSKIFTLEERINTALDAAEKSK